MIIKLFLNIFKLRDGVFFSTFGITLIYFTDVERMLVRRFKEVNFVLEGCVVFVQFLVVVSSLPCFMELRFQLSNNDILFVVSNSLLSGFDVKRGSEFHFWYLS